jgi:SAM-dependent methyltransferase
MQLTTDANEDRFYPINLQDEDVEDLATFTGLSPGECRERVASYSSAELTAAWRRAAPSTHAEIVEFYRSTDLYLWDLMQWHSSASRDQYANALGWFATNFPPEAGFGRVFDFGCGIGTDGIYLAERGYQVTAVDVGGKVLDFARHRFKRRGLQASFLESRTVVPEVAATFDAAVCFDVFEHLPQPLAAARRLVGALRPGGILLQQASFGGSAEHPYHLEEGVARYGGMKWHIHLCGLGLVNKHPMAYQKVNGRAAVMQRARYGLWRATGLWLVNVGRG